MDSTQQDHQRIVARLRERCGGLWPLLAQDDEARQHLAGHLAGAGLWEELLALTTATDAWAKVRFAAEGSYDGYLADLERVRQWAATLPGGGWGVRVRCALLASSTRIPEAEDYGGDMDMRAQAFAALAHFLQGGLKAEAVRRMLGTLRTMWNQLDAAEDLGWLVQAGDLPDECVEEALAVARGFKRGDDRAQALNALLPCLSDAVRAEVEHEALDAALAEESEAGRACAIGVLARNLPAEQQDRLLAATAAFTNEAYRMETLQDLAPYLPPELHGQALEIARGIEYPGYRADALAALAEYLHGKPQEQVAGEALAAAHQDSEQFRAQTVREVMMRLPDHLKTEEAQRALDGIRMIPEEECRVSDLRELMLALPEGLKSEVLAMVRGFGNGGVRAEALSRLVDVVPVELQGQVAVEALAAAQGLGDPEVEAGVLLEVLEYLPDERRDEVLPLLRQFVQRRRAEAMSRVAKIRADAEATEPAGDRPPDNPFFLEALQLRPLSWLADYLPELQEEVLGGILAVLEQGPRRDLVSMLRGRMGLLERVGGVPALVELMHALTDTAAWWPSPKSQCAGARDAVQADGPPA